VRELVLILPDVFAPETVPAAALARAPLTRWRFAPARALRGGWRGWFAACLGRADAARVDPATVMAAAAGLDLAEPWVATPLHLLAGMHTVHVPPQAVLQLDEAECAALEAAFARQFADRHLSLHTLPSGEFLLAGLVAPQADTLEPRRLMGGTLADGLPAGAAGAPLRALMSEIEMWLHTLPLNAQRERRGAVPISTLWLWGGGHSPREPLAFSDERARARFQRIHASEGWASALVNLCGLQERLAASPRSWADLAQDEHFDVDSVCALVPLAERGILGIDEAFITPAAQALHAGRLERLVIAADDRAVELRARDRWRFWRPARDLLEALSESGR
jgi:hypothetical protein